MSEIRVRPDIIKSGPPTPAKKWVMPRSEFVDSETLARMCVARIRGDQVRLPQPPVPGAAGERSRGKHAGRGDPARRNILVNLIDGELYGLHDQCLHRGVPLSAKPECYKADTVTYSGIMASPIASATACCAPSPPPNTVRSSAGRNCAPTRCAKPTAWSSFSSVIPTTRRRWWYMTCRRPFSTTIW